MSSELTTVNLLKCKNCNLVVNELLTFVQNKNDTMDSESLVRICASAFSTDDIEKAKSLLFNSITSEIRNIKRKKNSKEGKSNKDLYDIIDLFKQTDPEKIPIFVACDLNKLPPITFDHVDVSRLLKHIVLLKQEVENIKSSFVTVDQLKQLEEQIKFAGQNDISNETIVDVSYGRNVNLRRGAFIPSINNDSGPMGLSPLTSFKPINTNPETNKPTREVTDRSDEHASIPCCEALSRSHSYEDTDGASSSLHGQCRHVEADAVSQTGHRPARAHIDNTVRSTVVSAAPLSAFKLLSAAESFDASRRSTPSTRRNETQTRLSYAAAAKAEVENKQKDKDSEWTVVRRTKYKDRFVGKKGTAISNTESKFKAADIRIPFL